MSKTLKFIFAALLLLGTSAFADELAYNGIGICNPTDKTSCSSLYAGGDHNGLGDSGGFQMNSDSFGSSSLLGGGIDQLGLSAGSASVGQICASAAAGVQSCASPTDDDWNVAIGTSSVSSKYLSLETHDWNMASRSDGGFMLQAVSVTRVAAPEPGTLLLLGSGLVGLAAPIRRRFKK